MKCDQKNEMVGLIFVWIALWICSGAESAENIDRQALPN